MKKFFTNIICFVLPFLLVVIGIFLISGKILRDHFTSALPSVHYIFLGHSQPECAIDDKLITNGKNLSQGGESYFYTYQKLKKILKDNPQLKMVIVSFSNNQIEKKMNDWTFDDIHLNQYYAKYNYMMSVRDISLILKNNPSYFFQANVAGLEINMKTILKRKNLTSDNNWGGYLYVNKSKLDSLKNINYIDEVNKKKDKKISETNILYLKKIVALCKTQKKPIIFIRTPYDKDLLKVYDEQRFQKIRGENFKDIPFWDFRDTYIPEDGFLDYDHLNNKGAKEFSVILNDKIKLSQTDK